MSEIVFRRLLATDAAEFQVLRLSALAESPLAFSNTPDQESGTPIEDIAKRFEGSKGFAIGAYLNDNLVGISNIDLESSPRFRHKAWLWGFYVAPEARRGGVGRLLLLATLEASFSIEHLLQINLGVNAVNEAARALYESCGFVAYGYERSYMIVDGIPQNEYHMVYFRDDYQKAKARQMPEPER